jgi:hypothetical protein
MDDKFLKIPLSILSRTDLTSTEKLIICSLIDRSGNNGVAWPGYDRIGKDLGVTKVAVLNAVKSLERSGWLVVDRQNGMSNRYRINTSKETIPVKKLYSNPYRNYTTASKETIPESDQLNQTKRTRPNKEADVSLFGDDITKDKSKDANPEVKTFIDWFCEWYEGQLKRKYIVRGGKDGKQVKELLKNIKLEELKSATEKMGNDNFWHDKSSIGTLYSHINEIRNLNNNNRNAGKFVSAKPQSQPQGKYNALAKTFS